MRRSQMPVKMRCVIVWREVETSRWNQLHSMQAISRGSVLQMPEQANKRAIRNLTKHRNAILHVRPRS